MKSIFISITFCMLIFFILSLSFADFFINILLFEVLSETPPEYQTV